MQSTFNLLPFSVFPLSIAVPAAAASLAYLNARTAFISDIALLRSVAAGASVTKESARRDRVNLFYKLEELALSSKSANRIFLAVPPEIPTDVQTLEDLRGLACIEWTYREVYDKILQFAAWLRDDHQVRKGDIVALNFKNSAEFVFIWFAIWSLGAKAGLINTGLREKALLHCVTAAQSKLLILDPLLQETLSPEVQAGLADAGVKVTIVDDGIENKIYSTSGYRAPDKDRGGVKHTDLALLIYTSGTTGLPKPAVVPWRRFHNSAKSMATWLGMKPTDRYYTVCFIHQLRLIYHLLTQSKRRCLSITVPPRYSGLVLHYRAAQPSSFHLISHHAPSSHLQSPAGQP